MDLQAVRMSHALPNLSATFPFQEGCYTGLITFSFQVRSSRRWLCDAFKGELEPKLHTQSSDLKFICESIQGRFESQPIRGIESRAYVPYSQDAGESHVQLVKETLFRGVPERRWQ